MQKKEQRKNQEKDLVLSQIQTTNFNPSFLKTRQTGTTSSGFQLALDVEEAVTVPHGQETIGYLAIEAGAGSWGSIAFEAVTTPAVFDSTGVNLSFSQNFGQAPRFLSSLGSYLGQNPAQLRYDNLTGSGVQVRVEEETTFDSEVAHVAESISYLALGGNGLLAGAPLIGQVLGETGTLTDLTDQPQTILFHATYNNPVVFAQSASRNGTEPVVVRVTDVQADRFTIYLQEPSDRNDIHTTETVSYLVLEAGTWQLSDGTLVEAGQVSTSATVGMQLSDQWAAVPLATPWANSPVVLSQVQTANDSSFVKTRQQAFTSDGFQVGSPSTTTKSLTVCCSLSSSRRCAESSGWTKTGGTSNTSLTDRRLRIVRSLIAPTWTPSRASWTVYTLWREMSRA
ncbi:MAG: hypothetical protein IH790_02735, partial [Acidobacteria bacterium]|nr:hypothetical protein [Acidobacteriota bacterium]